MIIQKPYAIYREYCLARRAEIVAAYARTGSYRGTARAIQEQFGVDVGEQRIARFLREEGWPKLPVRNPPAEARMEEVLALRAAGLTFKAIGARYGITPERGRQLYQQAERMERRRHNMEESMATTEHTPISNTDRVAKCRELVEEVRQEWTWGRDNYPTEREWKMLCVLSYLVEAVDDLAQRAPERLGARDEQALLG